MSNQGIEEARRRIKEALKNGSEKLDLSRLGISELPEEMLSLQGQIKSLDVSENRIGPEGAKKIAENFTSLTHLDVTLNYIGVIGAMAIAHNLISLTELGIHGNKIGNSGAKAIGTNLRSLIHLNIGHNSINDEGIIDIAESLGSLNYLYLPVNHVTDRGGFVIAKLLLGLRELDMGYNQIGNKTAENIAKYLTNLTNLSVANSITNLPGVFAICSRLKSLRDLNISGIKLEKEGAMAIAENLKSLNKLDISNNKIGKEGAEAISEELQSLEVLNIGNNNIGDYGTATVCENLKSLTELRISQNDITTNGAKTIADNLELLKVLDISFNRIRDAGVVTIAENLQSLRELKVWNTEIGNEGAIAIAENLKNLEILDISANLIDDSGIIAIAKYLKKLVELQTWSNQVSDKGAIAIAKELKFLRILAINHNIIGDQGLEAIATSTYLQRSIVLMDNNAPQNIPAEAMQSWETLRQYFQSISSSKTIDISTAKILLLGNTTAGKSNLLAYYVEPETFKSDKIESTYGIQHHIRKEDKINLSIWDFGGQEYFHGTHRLFMNAKNAVYLVLWEYVYEDGPGVERKTENDKKDVCYPFRYWLGAIRHFNPVWNPDHVFLIQSKADETAINPRQNISDSYTHSKGRFRLNPDNIMYLSVHGAHSNNDRYQYPWKIFEARLNDVIQQAKEEYQFNEDLYNLAEKIGVTMFANELYVTEQRLMEGCRAEFAEIAKYKDLFISYLEGSGKIIIFHEFEKLKDKIFIKPQRLLNRIYGILNEKILTEGGIFKAGDIQDGSGKDKATILQLMLDMDLIFEDPHQTHTYIAPQFLQANMAISGLLGHFKKILKPSFTLRFPDFMPRAYITQFISRYGSQAVEGVYWKFGVLYNHKVNNDTAEVKILVEADTDMQLVRVYAEDVPFKYEALKKVFEFFTIDKVPDEKFDQIIIDFSVSRKEFKLGASDKFKSNKYPQVGYLELSAEGQHFASIDAISEAIDNRMSHIKATDGQYFTIESIFHYLLNKTNVMPKKIFFSYSRYESQYLDEFKVHFSALKKQGLVETWFDGDIEAGADANAAIKKQLLESDIIICLLSPRFMDNDYIWKIEMEEAKKNNKTIIPVTIKACDYKSYFADYFGEDKQGFITDKQFYEGQQETRVRRRDIIWIATAENLALRDEYYAFIVEQLKKQHFSK